MNSGLEYCVYITPCGYCSKFDKWCKKKCKNSKREKVKVTSTDDTMNRIKSGLGLAPLD